MITTNLVTPGVVVNEAPYGDKALSTWIGQNTKHLWNRQSRSERFGITNVGQLLRSYGPMPADSILLGQCNDGLPFLLELSKPEMGAILVCCEAGGGKTHQLQVMVESAIRTHAPKSMQVTILTLNPGEWTNLNADEGRQAYLQGVYGWHDPQVEDVIQRLMDFVDARRQKNIQGTPDILFILDDINFLEELSYESQVNLRWLLEYGAQFGIWLVGSIDVRYAESFQFWIEPFRTRILGQVVCPEIANTVSIGLSPHVSGLEPGSFQVFSGHDWVKYRLLPLGD